MLSVVPENRPQLPAGPPKLNSYDLKRAQGETLSIPRMKYGPFARALFIPVDVLHGKRGSLAKFAVIEVVARVPYQAWERVGYWTVHRHASRSALAKRIFVRIVEARSDQDNEQWHLLILRDLIQREGIKQGWFMHRVIPFLMAMVFYHVSWVLFLLRPAWSYRLNAESRDRRNPSTSRPPE